MVDREDLFHFAHSQSVRLIDTWYRFFFVKKNFELHSVMTTRGNEVNNNFVTRISCTDQSRNYGKEAVCPPKGLSGKYFCTVLQVTLYPQVNYNKKYSG